MKINEVVCIYELKKLEIREGRQQLNEFVFLAALPWLIGAGLSAYDYYNLREKNQGKNNPADWDKASQLELGAGVAGTAAGGVLGRYLGKGIGWAAGKVARGASGAVKGAGKAAKTAKALKKVAAKNRSTDTAAAGRRVKGGQFAKGSNVKGTMATKVGAAAGAGARAGLGKGLGKAAPWKTAGKRLGALGATAGVIAGREAGKELGSLAGLYGRDDKDGKDGKAKSDWWTSQQAKHKTGTRQATSSIPKPIPKPEFAHKYPELTK
jgi:hypothetical protein